MRERWCAIAKVKSRQRARAACAFRTKTSENNISIVQKIAKLWKTFGDKP